MTNGRAPFASSAKFLWHRSSVPGGSRSFFFAVRIPGAGCELRSFVQISVRHLAEKDGGRLKGYKVAEEGEGVYVELQIRAGGEDSPRPRATPGMRDRTRCLHRTIIRFAVFSVAVIVENESS